MKSDRIDLGLTGYDELFMSTEERLDAKKAEGGRASSRQAETI